ncbi:hypothetical protein Nepgr_022785 [Nepenthes gracilis]|uniref:Uncharacterized protein n=1 Tax=Nepenthes gracilis TaxID=150966 RepID=A0AAD3SZR0_NEPGR|nr:hypothetical protein Nepgr_022785 [Nepenthes gracilis]
MWVLSSLGFPVATDCLAVATTSDAAETGRRSLLVPEFCCPRNGGLAAGGGSLEGMTGIFCFIIWLSDSAEGDRADLSLGYAMSLAASADVDLCPYVAVLDCDSCRLPTPDLACGGLAGQLVDRHHGLRYVLWSAKMGCPVGLTWSFWGSLASASAGVCWRTAAQELLFHLFAELSLLLLGQIAGLFLLRCLGCMEDECAPVVTSQLVLALSGLS